MPTYLLLGYDSELDEQIVSLFSIEIDRAESNPLARFERRGSLKGNCSCQGCREILSFFYYTELSNMTILEI